MFWNEEGIYYVQPSKQGGSAHSPDIALDVDNLALGTILTYYSNIPVQSKKFARGDYDPLGYIVQWCFKSTNESSVTTRYQYDKILSMNTATKAFYTYTLPSTPDFIHGIIYVSGPGGSTSPNPVLKYLYSDVNGSFISFAEENDPTFVDWGSVNYISTFTTGYNVKGRAALKFQTPYIWMYFRNSNQYLIQAAWDFAISGNSGKISVRQKKVNNLVNFAMGYDKIRLRGRGQALQIIVTSLQGQPFDFMGWAIIEEINQGV
jgi:hypothetical protein